MPARPRPAGHDLTAPVDGSVQFQEIGTGLVLADAAGPAASLAEMIITPDGGTLILAGSTSVIVTPTT